MSRKRSKKGFWSFLRSPKKAPRPESETSGDAGALTGEQDARQTPKKDSFDALFAYLDEEQHDAELESSTGPPEALEQTKDRESPPSEWEISEKTEAQVSKVPEQEALEEMEMREAESPDLEPLKEAEIPESETRELEPLKKGEPEESEATERQSLKEAETSELEAQEAAEPDPLDKSERSDPREDKLGSGRVLEKLRGLEEQMGSLESCITKRINSHR